MKCKSSAERWQLFCTRIWGFEHLIGGCRLEMYLKRSRIKASARLSGRVNQLSPLLWPCFLVALENLKATCQSELIFLFSSMCLICLYSFWYPFTLYSFVTAFQFLTLFLEEGWILSHGQVRGLDSAERTLGTGLAGEQCWFNSCHQKRSLSTTSVQV